MKKVAFVSVLTLVVLSCAHKEGVKAPGAQQEVLETPDTDKEGGAAKAVPEKKDSKPVAFSQVGAGSKALAGNQQPKILHLVAYKGSKATRLIKPNASVTIEAIARDPDGDALTYDWQVAFGAGQLEPIEQGKITWKTGRPSGKNDLKLVVSDGRGGQTQAFLKIDDGTDPIFSGKIVTVGNKPIQNADVTVNGNAAKTDSKGKFKIALKEGDDETFIVTVRKPGYGLLSRIFDKPIDDVTWQLPPGIKHSVDPTKPISVKAPFRRRQCRGSLSSRVDWSRFKNQHTPRFYSSSGVFVTGPFPGELQAVVDIIEAGTECSPGFAVQIPANSLVDASGNPPTGNVTISMSTVDLFSPEGMPGDYTVRTGETTGVMRSTGAGTIDIYGGGGKSYNLKTGAQAELTIPVDPLQVKKFPKSIAPTIPLLIYDEARGIWKVEGTMKLNQKGDAYVAKVGHFSAFNADLIKTDQSCVRVDSQGIQGDYNLEITIPIAGSAPVVRTFNVDNTPETLHAVYNLPSNTDIVLRPFRMEATGPVPLGNFGVNTGPPQVPTDPNRPVFPYQACQSEVFLEEQSTVPDTPAAPTNLQGQWSSLSTLNLTWTDNATNETGYRIYRSFYSASGPFDYLGQVPANTTSEPITDLMPCQDHWFRVSAVNGSIESAYSNSIHAPQNTVAKVAFTGSLPSPFVNDGVTHTVYCFDSQVYNGGYGLLDMQRDHVMANESTGDPQRVFPREPVLRQDLSGRWDLVYGSRYDGPSDIVLYGRLSSWASYHRSQFFAVYLSFDEQSGQIAPFSMWAGDMDTDVQTPLGDEWGKVMASTQSPPSLPDGLDGYMPGSSGQLGYLYGRVVGNVFFVTPSGTTYGSSINIEFNMPIHNE
ncbi:MAG: hypothetical protein QNJ97_06500 [Myxococcota bacterium]|nr:hypothetical protein [Myxococcota bacterium]